MATELFKEVYKTLMVDYVEVVRQSKELGFNDGTLSFQDYVKSYLEYKATLSEFDVGWESTNDEEPTDEGEESKEEE